MSQKRACDKGCCKNKNNNKYCGGCNSSSDKSSSSSSSGCSTSSSSSGCSTSSSSSSSSSLSSSSSINDLCTERNGDCAYRKRSFTGTICPKHIETYSLDTCLIEFKPRLITVPSKKYPCIDDAFASLAPRRGGYVIQLLPGIHRVTRGVCLTVDYLHIIGDCCPFVGTAYINACNVPVASDFEYCYNDNNFTDNSNILGKGPFTISVVGRRVVINGQVPPNFGSIISSPLCCNRVLNAFHSTGTISTHEVRDGSGNTLILGTDVGFGSSAALGEGFYIEPNVTMLFDEDNINIKPSHYLRIDGVKFDGTTNVVLGTPGLYMDLRNCVETITLSVHFLGRYHFTQPNVWLGRLFLSTHSIGSAYFQSLAGVAARLIGDGNAASSWRFCTFADAAMAVKLQNGSNVNFFGSQFVNNCIGLYVTANSQATIYGTSFCGNRFAMIANYGSTISSILTTLAEYIELPPVIRDNFYAMIAEWNSQIIVTAACFSNNTHHAMIDSSTHTTAESIPVGHYGPRYSLVVDTVNPSIVNAQGTRCVNGTLAEQASANLLNIVGHHSIVSRSVVRGDVTIDNRAGGGRGEAQNVSFVGSGLGANSVLSAGVNSQTIRCLYGTNSNISNINSIGTNNFGVGVFGSDPVTMATTNQSTAVSTAANSPAFSSTLLRPAGVQ